MYKVRLHELEEIIRKCRYSSDVDDKVTLLHRINSMLPKLSRLDFPSLLTKDYVNRALDIIEERIDPASRNKAVAMQ